MRVQTIAALAVVALAAAACGGGGGGSAPNAGSVLPAGTPAPAANATTPATLPAGYATASVKITIPKASVVSGIRRTQTVGTGTASITFTLLQTTGTASAPSPQSFGLTSSSPGCTTDSNSNLICTLSVNAPIGTDIFLAQTYSAANQLTGSGAVALAVAQNATNTASVSLNSQVSSVVLTTASTYLGTVPVYNNASKAQRGAASGARATIASRSKQTGTGQFGGPTVNSTRVFVIALDSANNIVLNPSTYDQPIQVQLIYASNNYYSGYSPDVSDPADATLQVQYGSSDASGCGGNAQTSVSFGTVNVCSPSDILTLTEQNVINGAPYALLLASVNGSGNLPSPMPSSSSQPTPVPTTFPAAVGSALVEIFTTGGISLEDDNYNPVTEIDAYGLGSNDGATNLPYNQLNIYESGFTGSYSVGGTCAPYATLNLTNNGNGYSYLSISPTAVTGPSGCTLTVSDGTNSISIPMYVGTTAVTGQ